MIKERKLGRCWVFFLVAAGIGSCSRQMSPLPSNPDQEERSQAEFSTVSTYFDSRTLALSLDTPDLYELTLEYRGIVGNVVRRGELPLTSGVMKLDDLPTGAGVLAKMALFSGEYSQEAKTHECEASKLLNMVPGANVTVAFVCYEVHSEEAVEIFKAVSTLALNIGGPGQEQIEKRLANKRLEFSSQTAQGETLSLRKNGSRFGVVLSGVVSYQSPDQAWDILLQGEEVPLTVVGGALRDVFPQSAVAVLSSSPSIVYSKGQSALLLSISITNSSQTLKLSGALLEEPPKEADAGDADSMDEAPLNPEQ